MNRFARAALLSTALLAASSGCRTNAPTQPPTAAVPTAITTDAALVDGLNIYAMLAENDPARPALRKAAVAYLLEASADALAAGDHDRALGAIERTVDLWTPQELRAQTTPHADLANAALRLYEVASREGREFPATFALGVVEAFGDPPLQKRARHEWRLLVDWLEGGRQYPADFRHPPIEVQDVLEQACAAFPSPWLTDELATIYRAQIPILRAVDDSRVEDRALPARGEFAGFLLIRAYLRADDFDAARESLPLLGQRTQTESFRTLVTAATAGDDDVQPLLDLIAYLQPDDDSANLPRWLITQGWGIVDNIARRALLRDPENVHANLARAHSLRQLGLVDASIVHLERAIGAREDLFDAWSLLAELYQERIQRDSARAPERGAARLEDLEAFHRRAAKLWSDRPIRPGLPDAYLTVATAHFDAGRPDLARPLLEQSTAIEPLAGALDLLGTIEHRAGQLERAAGHYQALLKLPFVDQAERIDWEIQARTQLGQVALDQQQARRARDHLKVALQQLNVVLSTPRLPEREYSVRLVERYRVLFLLGETDLAMDDFRNSVAATPDQPALYAQCMLLATSHARYEAAYEIYRRAMVRDEVPDSLKLYFSLWLLDLAEREHRPLDPDATRFVQAYHGEPWHVLLARHSQGRATLSDLEAHAENTGHRAEAYFYEGLRQWRLGNTRQAADLLQQVLDTNMMSFFEYEMAQVFLASETLAPYGSRAAQP
ncbi:MAG: hypothetical protein B7733_09005 [Myxococcales bacterium FL481]|nr:MAG: hypothetical protein B7733_09005 [Myxococcales bacterium FL481]